MQKNPLPPNQEEVLFGKNITPNKNRAGDVRRDNDNVGTVSIGLYEVDAAILFYINEHIRPLVRGKEVPVLMTTPERWVSIKKHGFYRDEKGKMKIPLILVRRTGMSPDRTISRNIDANNPQVRKTVVSKYSSKMSYDNFSATLNLKPQKEVHNVVIPNYVKLTYEVILWTDYVEDMNKLQEAFSFADSAYWGDPNKFKFYTVISNYSNQTEVQDNDDRAIRCSFELSLNGYIIPDALQKEINEQSQKDYTIKQLAVSIQGITEGQYPGLDINPAFYTQTLIVTQSCPATGSVTVWDYYTTQDVLDGTIYSCSLGESYVLDQDLHNVIPRGDSYTCSIQYAYVLDGITSVPVAGNTSYTCSIQSAYILDFTSSLNIPSNTAYTCSIQSANILDGTSSITVPSNTSYTCSTIDNRILIFTFDAAVTSSLPQKIGTYQAGTYTSQSFYNTGTPVFFVNNIPITLLPFTVNNGDTLRVLISPIDLNNSASTEIFGTN